MRIRKDYTCPLEISHDILKGKWKSIIIYMLQYGRIGPSELGRQINGINQKMLLEQLGELRAFGLVGKYSSQGYPLHVEYFLTERGQKALEAFKIMQQIGIEYMVEQNMTDILDAKGICYVCPERK